MDIHVRDWQDFVIDQLFNVTGVDVKTEPIWMETGTRVIGGSSSRSMSGYKSVMKLSVKAEDSPVKLLTIVGSYPIFNGNQIRAYMVAAEWYTFHESKSDIYDNGRRTGYERRELGETENAFKIEKLCHGQVAATYNSPVDIPVKKQNR